MRRIPWFKVDDAFHSHPKVMELTTGAVGLWTLAGAWCADYLTDGEIRTGQLRRLGGTEDEAAQLVEAGLWIPTEDGYRFRDWHDYQPTRESVEAERDASRERQRKRREAREKHRRDKQGVTASSQRDTPVSHAPVTEEFVTPVPEPVPEVPKGTSNMRDEIAQCDAEDYALIPPEDAGPSLADKFNEFYAAYPRKRDRARAKEAFEKAVKQKKVDPDRIISAAQSMANDPNLPEATVIPHATTWLNGERWDDPPYEPRSTGGPPQQFQSAAERRYAQGMSLVQDELREFYNQPQEIER